MSTPGGSVPVYHTPRPRTVIVARDPKTGRPTLVKHECSECGRLISQGRHVG